MIFSKHVLYDLPEWGYGKARNHNVRHLISFSVSNYRCFGYLLYIITHWKEHNHTTLKVHRRPPPNPHIVEGSGLNEKCKDQTGQEHICPYHLMLSYNREVAAFNQAPF